MKKVLFASLFTVAASAAFAQGGYIRQGDWLAGGTAGFNSTKQGDYKTNRFNLSPNVGYFFINQFAGGLRASVGSSKNEYGSGESKTTSYSLAPFVRYYFLPASQKVNVFADGSFGFGQSKTKVGTSESKYNYTALGLRAGAAIFITPATALELGLGFNSTKEEDVEDRENTFGLEIGFQIHIPGRARK